jgi:hypothetical protein
MLTHMQGVLALGHGNYSRDDAPVERRVTHASGALVRYLDLYDAESGGTFRLSVSEAVDVSAFPVPGTPVRIDASGSVRDGRLRLRVEALHVVEGVKRQAA